MFKESYTKFYSFMIAALILGFVGMEIATAGISAGDLSGMATHTIKGTESALGAGTPESNMLYLLIGIVVGAIIVGTAVYIYTYEKNRMY